MSEEVFSNGVAYLEGAYVPIEEARIPLVDWGFTRSDVTYDVVSVWDGAFFRLEDHLDRFENSCAAMRLSVGFDRPEIRDILNSCVSRAGLRKAYVEVGCTRGRPKPGSRDPRECTNSFFAFAIPFVWIFSPELQKVGPDLIISKIPRIAPESLDPATKNFHWGDLTKGLFEAYELGGDSVVLVDDCGNISEGPGFNVFCVKDGRATTPDRTVLEGITRKTVREICEELNIPCSLGMVTPDDLREADEVFVSSTAGGPMGIARIDGKPLAGGWPGSLTNRVRERYWEKHKDPQLLTLVEYAV